MIQSRYFNKIDILDTCVIKTSLAKHIQGEIYFYSNIPNGYEMYFPNIISIGINPLNSNERSITMERLNGITLSFLLINHTFNESHLRSIITVLNDLHMIPIKNENINIYSNWYQKTKYRYKHNIEIYHSLDEDIRYIRSFILIILGWLQEYQFTNSGKHVGCIHGDSVLTNIILTTNGIKMIDMRGYIGNTYTIEGDMYYDWSKIYQSLWGYDYIILDREITERDENYLQELRSIFIRITGLSENILNYMVISHLISIIPLHNNINHRRKFMKLAQHIYNSNSN